MIFDGDFWLEVEVGKGTDNNEDLDKNEIDFFFDEQWQWRHLEYYVPCNHKLVGDGGTPLDMVPV